MFTRDILDLVQITIGVVHSVVLGVVRVVILL